MWRKFHVGKIISPVSKTTVTIHNMLSAAMIKSPEVQHAIASTIRMYLIMNLTAKIFWTSSMQWKTGLWFQPLYPDLTL